MQCDDYIYTLLQQNLFSSVQAISEVYILAKYGHFISSSDVMVLKDLHQVMLLAHGCSVHT